MTFAITSKDALLVVDVQNDFCTDGALAVPDGDLVVPVINQLSPRFQTVVLTQDWHPKEHISFATNHNLPVFDFIELPYGEQILWPHHCVQGSWGAAFHPDLHTANAQLIIRKGYNVNIDSYSGFMEADRITPTGLSGYLHMHGIQRVFIAGLATDFCVAWTAMDAVHFGFECFVIDDACQAINVDNSLANAWEDMTNSGVHKICVKDILQGQ